MIATEVHDYREALAISNRVNAFDSVFNDAEKDWKPPDEGWFKVNSDGSYWSHSDEISFGCVIRKDDGTWFSGFSKKLGKGSIFLAEIWGAFLDLKLTWECNIKKVILETDSILVKNFILKAATSIVPSLSFRKTSMSFYEGDGRFWCVLLIDAAIVLLINLLKVRSTVALASRFMSPSMGCDSLYRDDLDKVLLGHRQDWKPPDEGWFKVNSDGSYWSHSDEISCGGVIRKDDGTWFSCFSKKLGKGSIFLTEIWGCNKYSPLFKLSQDFNELLSRGWQVLVHVMNRCCNSVADKLAKSAQYNSFGFKNYDSPPMSCDSLYRDDIDKVLLAHRQVG
ncbi:ribonuclease H [Senna tora]|uniref:Ribonuclease H n=1 Tax=Senna tora TaxID=362788 RepID=A0A834XD73_9FABA|nr:ribonuclease H [Senna tora]